MRLIKRGLLAAGGLMLAGMAILTVIAVSETGSASAQVVDATPATPYQTALAGQLGISVDQLRTDQKAAMDAAIDQSVASGSMTADQGAKLKAGDLKDEKQGARESKRHRAGRVLGRMIDSAAKTIGITPKDTKQGLKNGQSLTQIAGAHNMTRDQLKAGMTTDLSAQIQQALANSRITQAQATKLQGNLSTRLDKVIDRTGRHGKK